MLDPVKIAQAVEKYKLPVVCASCTKYWKARDRGLPEPQCASVDGCASPIGGGNFHEYEGPIPDFKIWCFVCGAGCNKFIFVKGKERTFGICDEHLEDAKSLAPINVDPISLERYYIDGNRILPLNEGSLPFTNNSPNIYKKKGFRELFNEVEGYYAKKNNLEWIDV